MKNEIGWMGKMGWLLLLLGGLTGCVTNRNSAGQVTSYTFLGQTITPTNAYTVVEGLSNGGARAAVNADSNSTVYLKLVYDTLNDALASTNFSPADLVSNLNALDKGNLAPLAVSGITDVLLATAGLFGGVDASAASLNPFILPIFEGIRDGIALVIGRPLGKAPLPWRNARQHGPGLAYCPVALLAVPRRKRALQTFALLGLLGLLALGAAGCAGSVAAAYPKTKITGFVDGKPFSFEAPKDYDVTGFDAAVDTNGAIHLHVDSLKSSLTVSNLSAVANGQAAIVTATGVQIINGINAGASLAGSALKAAAVAP